MRKIIGLAGAAIVLAFTAERAWAADTVLDNLTVNDGSTYTVGAGDTLSVGSGSGNYVYIASGSGTTGTLDVSASAGFTANVGNFYIGTGGSGGIGSAYLGVNNTITAATLFGVGTSFWDWTTGTLTTAAGGTTTIHTPDFKIGWAIANGTSSGTGTMTLGAGAALTVDGLSGGRAAMWIGYDEEQYGRSSSGILNLSGGTASLTLSSLMVGGQTGNGNTPGTLTFGTSGSNHLDVSGAGNVVRIGYLGLFGSSGTGSSTGTVTLANLDATSSITSTDNSTAILIGQRVATATGSTTGTLNLNGGTLTITTTGTAIGTAGSGGTSNLNLDGITLKAGASSTTWMQGLTSAKIKSGGVTFDTNGNDITVAQALLTDAGSPGGGLAKQGAGTLTLTGANTFTGATSVTGGRLVVASSSALLTNTSVSIGAGELQFDSATPLAVAPVFAGSGGTLSGVGFINGAVDVTNGNTLAPGNPSGTLTLNGLTLGDNTTVRVASGGNSLVQINGDYADSLGAHALVTGLATPNTPYTFFTWTGSSGSLLDGIQANWTVAEGDTGTKRWTAATSGDWTTASSWDGFLGGVNADTAAKTLSYTMTYVESGTKAPTGGNDVVIDPTASGITVTGPGTAAAVKSLQVGGGNNSSPTLALGAGSLTVTEAVTVTGDGQLNATTGALIAPTIHINSAGASATLGHASGSIGTANISGGTLTVSEGTVSIANLSGTGTLAGGHAVPEVNVTGGTPSFTGTATVMTVSGGSIATGGAIGTLTLPSGSTGEVVVGAGTTVETADFSAGAGTVAANNTLVISNQLQLSGGLTITAGATPFKAGGVNVVSHVDTLVLQGSTTTISQTIGGMAAGLDVRAWQGPNGQIDGTLFDITESAPAGSSTHSTFAGTIGNATQSINMGGNDQEHFGDNTNSGVPNGSIRPTGYANNYTVEYRGKILITADGTYRFATTSDDGSALWIDQGDVATANPLYSTAAVQNSYYQGMTTRNSGQLTLTAGYHDFIVRMYEGGGGNGLQVQWDPTGGTSWAAIPGENYYHGGLTASAVNLPDTDIAATASSELNLGAVTETQILGGLILSGEGTEFSLSGAASLVSFDRITATSNSRIGGVPITLRTGEVTVETDQTLVMAAEFMDGASAMTLTKLGGGTLTLSNDVFMGFTHTGGTEVQEGLLTVNGFLAGDVTVGYNAAIGGYGTIGGSLTLSADAAILFSEYETLYVNGAIALGNLSVANVWGLHGSNAAFQDASLDNRLTYTLIAGTITDWGTVQTGEGSAVSIGGGKSAYFQEGSLQLVVIPEPATFGLLGVMGLALLLNRRLRRTGGR